MLSNRFTTAVVRALVNVQANILRTQDQPPALSRKYSPDDTVAFVDLQSLHFLLRDNFDIKSNHVHIPNLVKEIGKKNSLNLKSMFIFTGIHDPKKSPDRYDSMQKRLLWMERSGAQVFTIPLSYYVDHNSHTTRTRGKGIDVLICSELLRATSLGLRKILLISQDPELAIAIRVATQMADANHEKLEAFSIAIQGDDGWISKAVNAGGINETTKVPLHKSLVTIFARIDTDEVGSTASSTSPLPCSTPLQITDDAPSPALVVNG
jgi:hypothetical protein